MSLCTHFSFFLNLKKLYIYIWCVIFKKNENYEFRYQIYFHLVMIIINTIKERILIHLPDLYRLIDKDTSRILSKFMAIVLYLNLKSI